MQPGLLQPSLTTLRRPGLPGIHPQPMLPSPQCLVFPSLHTLAPSSHLSLLLGLHCAFCLRLVSFVFFSRRSSFTIGPSFAAVFVVGPMPFVVFDWPGFMLVAHWHSTGSTLKFHQCYSNVFCFIAIVWIYGMHNTVRYKHTYIHVRTVAHISSVWGSLKLAPIIHTRDWLGGVHCIPLHWSGCWTQLQTKTRLSLHVCVYHQGTSYTVAVYYIVTEPEIVKFSTPKKLSNRAL